MKPSDIFNQQIKKAINQKSDKKHKYVSLTHHSFAAS